ncbi:hypothetical protein ACGFYE_34340 [Streptomyces zaomyceticus]|uniref:hypothetical protein n=1 Tax=Streptomyces zaomyceticus TaxID=68286 RepID=UPI003717AD03
MVGAGGERPVTVDNESGVVVIGDGNQVGFGSGSGSGSAAGSVVRSAYCEQVRRIAPPELVDRDDELAELADFCRAESGPAYAWWRADAWTGKTALLSWFALNPPPKVRVVPFFITARLGAQNDVAAYVDVVLEQLAELAGEALSTRLADATKAAHLLRLYNEASRICAERDERLVLLVDGLDEDRGVTEGADAYSIASLLPPAPAANTRVIVSGRLNPPLPGDVPEAHPLRDPSVVRTLPPSRYAQAIRTEAERELKAFLGDGRLSRDLLGLVVASGDGLTAEDLAHLTDTTTYAVRDRLSSRAGRTFVVREAGVVSTGVRDSYILAHEELHARASEMLGAAALGICRARLHKWFEDHRARGWPLDTPEYLLKGYFQLLRATGDLARMVDCALDDERRNRLLDATGNDATGLAELRAAGDGVTAGEEAPLTSMFRMSTRRRALETKTFRLPVDLPAAWVVAGLPVRGKSLARGIPQREERARALTAVAAALTRQGETGSADATFAAAEEAVREIRESSARRHAAERLTQACLQAHRFVQVRRLSEPPDGLVVWSLSASEVVRRFEVLDDDARMTAAVNALSMHVTPRFEDVVTALAELGDVAEAVAMARGAGVPTWRAVGLLRIAGVLRRREDGEAEHLVEEALAASALFGDRIAQALVEAGEVSEGVARAMALSRGERRSSDFTAIVGALAQAGDLRSVDALLTRLHEGPELSEAATVAAQWAAEQGDVDRSMRLARLITDDRALTRALFAVAAAHVRQGEVDRGVALAKMLSEQDRSAGPVVGIAVVLAECGHRGGAHDTLVDVESGLRARPSQHALHELAVTAEALARCGWRTEARRALDGVESCLVEITRSMRSVPSVGAALVGDIVKALARAGLFGSAEEAASLLASDPEAYDRVLVATARRMVGHGEFDEAERIARIPVGLSSSRLVAEVARDLAAAGEWDRSQRVALQRMAPYHRPWLLSELSGLRMEQGRPDRAAELLLLARDGVQQAPSIRGAAGLVRAAVRLGDWRTAGLAMAETEALAGKAALGRSALKEVMQALVAFREHDKATALVEGIASPSAQADARADLVGSLLQHGHRSAAYTVAAVMANGRGIARAHGALAHAVDEGEARALLAQALHRGWWTECLDDLLRIEPAVVPLALREVERLREELRLPGASGSRPGQAKPPQGPATPSAGGLTP